MRVPVWRRMAVEGGEAQEQKAASVLVVNNRAKSRRRATSAILCAPSAGAHAFPGPACSASGTRSGGYASLARTPRCAARPSLTRVVDDASVCRGEVDAQPAGARGQQEHLAVGICMQRRGSGDRARGGWTRACVSMRVTARMCVPRVQASELRCAPANQQQAALAQGNARAAPRELRAAAYPPASLPPALAPVLKRFMLSWRSCQGIEPSMRQHSTSLASR